MNLDYLTHWIIGLLCTVIWFWGDRVGIPRDAVLLAGATVPSVLSHAMAYTPKPRDDKKSSPPLDSAPPAGATNGATNP